MSKLKELFKPDLTSTKQKIIFGIKVAVALLYTYFMVIFWTGKNYMFWTFIDNKDVAFLEVSRIVIVMLLWIVGLVLLFINLNLSKKQNIISSIVLSVFSVLMIYFCMQFSLTQGSVGEVFKTIVLMRPIFTVFNLFILGTLFLVFYAIFNSFKAPIIILSIVSLVFSLVNAFVTSFRGTAFVAVDFTAADTGLNVASGYQFVLAFRLIVCIMMTMLLCIAACKLGKNPLKFWWLRVAVALLAVVCILIGYARIWNSTYYDKLIKVKYYKPQETYVEKGFYITFLKSIKDTRVKAPKGYSKEKVEGFAKKYKGTKATTKETPNIIVVMNEAFTDYTMLFDLNINKDNLPFLHSLKDNTIKGRMFTPVFGGGTVSTEFESLTTNTMTFEPYGVTSYTTFIHEPMESMASNLKEQGFGTAEALHPFIKEDYKRDKVYKYFGFDKFYGMEEFGDDPEICGTWISDNADVEKIIEKYEKYRKKSDKPYLMYNVTMQNHSPFLSGKVSGGFKLGYKANMKEANEYMNLIYHSDQAAKKLINYFKKVDEKTVVLFFGDHQPKIEDSFFLEMDKTFKLKQIPYDQRKRISSYYLWANYDIKENTSYDISSNYIEELLFKTAGVGMSGYQQMADNLMKDVPVLSLYGCLDKNGKSFMANDKKSPYFKRINDYNIAQYNDLHDVEHRVDKFFKAR
ncbi:MAG: sulfatase-like hydrolase/transferase [Eubacterium sp.]|nr:sulfatase-like hydrolase/transferase [Eubacterium sp.]